MPLSKTVTVERFVNGMRDVRYSEDIPLDQELVVLKDDDHTHLVFGDREHLEAAGLVKPKATRKPAAKKPAAKKAEKKPAAKKPAAKKPAAKRTTKKKA